MSACIRNVNKSKPSYKKPPLTIFDGDNSGITVAHFGTDDGQVFAEIAVEALVSAVVRERVGQVSAVRE